MITKTQADDYLVTTSTESRTKDAEFLLDQISTVNKEGDRDPKWWLKLIKWLGLQFAETLITFLMAYIQQQKNS